MITFHTHANRIYPWIKTLDTFYYIHLGKQSEYRIIGGLKSKGMDKTKDILFVQSIEKYDLVFLAETHVGYDSGIKHIGNFFHV